MVDVYWETFADGGRRYLRAGDWSLDPDDGDTPEYLEKSAEAFLAAAEFLRREQRKADPEWVAAEHAAGKTHATRKSRCWTRTNWQNVFAALEHAPLPKTPA